MLKKTYIIIFLVFLAIFAWRNFFIGQPQTYKFEKKTLWEFQCIDTMKDSRDRAREFLKQKDYGREFAKKQIAIIRDLGATCVSVGTPYDEEFAPVLRAWSQEAHAAGLNVWFRGNFSGWEGWFSYPKFSSAEDHHRKLKTFIVAHPDFFRDKDIFTPAPEPENGILGSPWKSEKNKNALNDFIAASTAVCEQGFKEVARVVSCGFFGTNGDVALGGFTTDSLQKAGGVVVTDHYIKDIPRYKKDIEALYAKHRLPVVVGEFGSPIPDLQGNLSEAEQAVSVAALLDQIYSAGSIVRGVNYWVLHGGSTSLVRDDGSPRMATEALRDYFKPAQVSGQVTNTLGKPISEAKLYTSEMREIAVTDKHGRFYIVLPAGSRTVYVQAVGYQRRELHLNLSRSQSRTISERLQPLDPSWWYMLRERLRF